MIIYLMQSQVQSSAKCKQMNCLCVDSVIDRIDVNFKRNYLNLLKNDYIYKFGNPNINIVYGEGFKIQIVTRNLSIKSVSKDDAYFMHKYLWGQPDEMKLYAFGETKTLEYTEERVNDWVQRWNDENPFSGMIVRDKSGQFIGHVIMGFGCGEQSSEIAFSFKSDQKSKNYGEESVGALTLFLSEILVKNKFKVNKNKEDFKKIIATCHPENVYSKDVLEKSGLTQVGFIQKYGGKRLFYQLDLN